MKLHIFNPEHDIALAHNDKYFTAPRAGRMLRADCGFIPVLWADEGDYVLVDDVEAAREQIRRLGVDERVNFITLADVRNIDRNIKIEPWGWDSALVFRLRKSGLPEEVRMPDERQLAMIRKLSGRQSSVGVLDGLCDKIAGVDGLRVVGRACAVENISELRSMVKDMKKAVLKAPWSSSGRGVRYVERTLGTATENWARHVIDMQGCIMIEPFYEKVMDFGMEFIADEEGTHYRGLSLFETANGFYTGNMLATEDYKLQLLSNYITKQAVSQLKEAVLQSVTSHIAGKYHGALGVDMMIVADGCTSDSCYCRRYAVHPMVEINLRRTMGHVAIDIASRMNISRGVMRIEYNDLHYHLRIEREVAEEDRAQVHHV